MGLSRSTSTRPSLNRGSSATASCRCCESSRLKGKRGDVLLKNFNNDVLLKNFNNAQYVPTLCKEFETVEIDIRDDT